MKSIEQYSMDRIGKVWTEADHAVLLVFLREVYEFGEQVKRLAEERLKDL